MSIFVSYSRTEISFTESLVSSLKDEFDSIWVDFQQLQVAHSWQNQLDNAVDDADTVLLVVSKTSIASKYVFAEWRQALEQGKRVILIIFEATELAPVGDVDTSSELAQAYYERTDLWEQLATCEWVDFRQKFDTALDQLKHHLQSTLTPPQAPVPQSGFKTPPIVKLMHYLSIFNSIAFTAVLLLLTCMLVANNLHDNDGVFIPIRYPLWSIDFIETYLVLFIYGLSIYIIYHLAFIPRQIMSRTHKYPRLSFLGGNAGMVVYMLAVVFFLVRFGDERQLPVVTEFGTLGIIACIITFISFGIFNRRIAYSEGFYRWSTPEGIYDPRIEVLRGFLKPPGSVAPIMRSLDPNYKKPSIRQVIFRTAIYAIVFGMVGHAIGSFYDAVFLFADTPPPEMIVLHVIEILIGISFFTYILLRERRKNRIKKAETQNQRTVIIEFAPPDRSIANSMERKLRQAGHSTVMIDSPRTAGVIQGGDIIFVLISKHKISMDVPESGDNVIPVFLENIDEINKLVDASNQEWKAITGKQGIDFRFGVHAKILSRLANSLHDPVYLIKSIESMPSKWQMTRANSVTSIMYVWIICLCIGLGSVVWIPNLFYLVSDVPDVIEDTIVPNIAAQFYELPPYYQEILEEDGFQALPPEYQQQLIIADTISQYEVATYGIAKAPEEYYRYNSFQMENEMYCFILSNSLLGNADFGTAIRSDYYIGGWSWETYADVFVFRIIEQAIECDRQLNDVLWSPIKVIVNMGGALLCCLLMFVIIRRLRSGQGTYLIEAALTAILILFVGYWAENNFMRAVGLFVVPTVMFMYLDRNIRRWQPGKWYSIRLRSK